MLNSALSPMILVLPVSVPKEGFMVNCRQSSPKSVKHIFRPPNVLNHNTHTVTNTAGGVIQ